MDIPNGGELPDEATLIFHVSGSKRFPSTGPCEGIDLEALKCDDDGISVTCVDLFEGSAEQQFEDAAKAMCSGITVRKSGVIARTTVGALRKALEDEPNKLVVVRDQLPGNDAHCLIKGVTADEIGVLSVLAQSVSDFTAVGDVEGLLKG